MSGPASLTAAPRDWWITLEANEDDVAGYVLGVQLLAAPPELKLPCTDRFCVDPANPLTRWGDGRRDPDDPHTSAGASSRAARAARAACSALSLGVLACALLLGSAGHASSARRHAERRLH